MKEVRAGAGERARTSTMDEAEQSEMARATALLHEHGLHLAQALLARAWAQEIAAGRRKRKDPTIRVKLAGRHPAELPLTSLIGVTPVSPPGVRMSRPASRTPTVDPAGAQRQGIRDERDDDMG